MRCSVLSRRVRLRVDAIDSHALLALVGGHAETRGQGGDRQGRQQSVKEHTARARERERERERKKNDDDDDVPLYLLA